MKTLCSKVSFQFFRYGFFGIIFIGIAIFIVDYIQKLFLLSSSEEIIFGICKLVASICTLVGTRSILLVGYQYFLDSMEYDPFCRYRRQERKICILRGLIILAGLILVTTDLGYLLSIGQFSIIGASVIYTAFSIFFNRWFLWARELS